MKKSYIDSSKNIQNKNWKQNIIINDINKENDKFICNKKYSVDILIKYHNFKSKENDTRFVQEHFQELQNEYNRIIEIVRNYVSQNPVKE